MNTNHAIEEELPPNSTQVIELELQQIRSKHIDALALVQAKLSNQMSSAETDAERVRLRNLFEGVSIEMLENIAKNESSNAAVRTAALLSKC